MITEDQLKRLNQLSQYIIDLKNAIKVLHTIDKDGKTTYNDINFSNEGNNWTEIKRLPISNESFSLMANNLSTILSKELDRYETEYESYIISKQL